MSLPSGETKAIAVIMKPRPTRADVMALALSLAHDEINDAEGAFHKQGPRLWAMWVQAKAERDRRDKADILAEASSGERSYWVLWTYSANYSKLHKVEARSPKEAANKVTGIFSTDFHQKARVYVFDKPPALAVGGELADPES